MEIGEILEAIRYNRNRRFERDAVVAAIEKREKLTPHLLRILEETIADAPRVVNDEGFIAHFYAMFLLAQFREERAYPLIVRLFSLQPDLVDALSGDFITEDFGPVLASVAGRDPGLICGLVENRNAFVWARVGALRAIVAMVAAGTLPREAALEYFRTLLRGKLEREPIDEVGPLWDSVVMFASDLCPEEIVEDIESALEDGLVDSMTIGLEDVRDSIRQGNEAALEQARRAHGLIDDTVEEMQGWACFKEEEQGTPFDGEPEPDLLQELEALLQSEGAPSRDRRRGQALARPGPKVGRNAPCPCGSGRKFKNCCGR